MRGMLCVATMLVAPVLGVSAQSGPEITQPLTSATANTESSPTSDDKGAVTTDTDDHNWHLRLGTISLSAAYFGGPGFYPYAYYPFYAMAPWDPFWGLSYSGYAPGFGYADGKGEVKLTGAPKDAKVYVNGGYAGRADRLKHMWLTPGAYDLAVAIPGGETFQQRIYVLSGKTLKIAASGTPNMPEKEKP
jgi:PEGA domain